MIDDIAIDKLIANSLMQSEALMPSFAGRRWTEEENEFIRANLGWLTDAEIGAVLERTEIAVHIHWERELNLTVPSKAPDVITCEQASLALGIDAHKMAFWIDVGFVPGRMMAADRPMRLINRVTFLRWSVTPANWIYFNIEHVQDPHLKRLIELRAARWGDEWWTTRQVADYYRTDIRNVNLAIKLGRIQAVRPEYSVGGRHPNGKWKYNLILKSEATSLDPRRAFPSREASHAKVFTPRARAWILHAHDDLGMTYEDICRTMKFRLKKFSAFGRYYHLIKEGKR